jgi:DNA helicase-4
LLNVFVFPFIFWSFKMDKDQAIISYGFKKLRIHILTIKNFKIQNFFGIRIFKIKYKSHSLVLLGFGSSSCLKIVQALNDAASIYSKEYVTSINECYVFFSAVLQGQHYIRKYLSEKLRQECSEKFEPQYLNFLVDVRNSFFFDKLNVGTDQKIDLLSRWINNFDQEIEKFNKIFVDSEKNSAIQLLSDLGQRTPTEEQLEAIVTFENNNLLVASAGSGKSATLVNKVCYALDKKYAASDEVLILAYGKDAAAELSEKFKDVRKTNINFIEPKSVSTFHSLGAKIISSTQKRLDIAEWAADSNLFLRLLKGFVQDLQKEPDFMWKLTTLCSLFRRENSFGQKQQEYFSRVFSEIDDSWDLKQEVKKEFNLLRTLNGEDVKSMEELIISNWYYMHGIEYQYEKPTDYKNLRGEARIHKPDFFLKSHGIYHEHFAINKDGTVPEYFHEGYLNTAAWKRKWYAEQKLPFFETTSAQFRDGSLFSTIESHLKQLNVPFKFKDSTDLEKIFDDGALDSLLNLISVSVRHIRNQGKTSTSIALNPQFKDELLVIFYDVVKAILKKYEIYMKQTQSLDFEALLIESANLVEQGYYKHSYKLILVDEFQDISHSRLKLLMALIRQNPSVIVFTVGDDWQGIYKFSGADLDIFVNFEKHVGSTKEMYLTKTFRSNQGITTVAADFVQKNKMQKQKKAVSSIPESDKVIEIINYKPRTNTEKIIEDIVSELVKFHNGQLIKVYILGRYNRSEPAGINRLKAQFKPNAEIEYKTFHKSKGLEAEYTILVGMNCEGMAFPSLKEDHPLLRVFVENNDNYPFAEERRLFYVALTRAKNKVFILCEDKKSSVFVDEIVKQCGGSSLLVQSYYG